MFLQFHPNRVAKIPTGLSPEFFFSHQHAKFAQNNKHRFRVCKPNLSNNQAAEKIFHSSKMPALWE
jgi:hypothetical protein